jgi:two-component system LytT family response regulator
MLKTVIIDDEKKAREFVESIIKNNFSEIQIVAKASSVLEGIKAINNNKPNLVFLDIEMQDGTGFDVLDALPDRNFEFIFITAYNQHAIKAFKYSAIDYLVKPIDIDEFNNAIKKILNKKSINNNNNYSILKENIRSKSLSKLAVPTRSGFVYINISDIVRFEADGRYSHIYLIGGYKHTVSRPLGEFTDLIRGNNFYKSHKSHLINLTFVKKFMKKDGGYIIMEDDSHVAISRNNREEFIEIMANLSA